MQKKNWLYMFLLPLVLFESCSDRMEKEQTDPDETSPENAKHLVYTAFKTYSYIQADFTGADTEYTITYPNDITSAAIRPYHLQIPVVTEGRTIRFKLPKAGNYLAEINGFKIAVFAETPEVLPLGGSVVNIVAAYACDITGHINETAKIQEAINQVAGTDKILYFPPGQYLSGQLRIRDKNGVNIHLARGAVLSADTTQLQSYSTDDVFGARSPVKTFIFIDRSQDVRISGYGMINGQGRSARRNAVVIYGSESNGRYRNLLITRSANVTIDGVVSADPGVWNTHILKSENVTCNNMKLLNELNYAPLPGDLNAIDHDRVNTDGFDLDASKNVLVKNCFAYCADDNVAVKTTEYAGLLDDVDGVAVQSCVFLTQKSSLKIGTETRAAEMKNIFFRNNDILEADRAIALYCYDGAKISNVAWDNTRVETHYPDAKRSVAAIEIKPREAGSKAGCATIEINNTTVLHAFPNKSEIKYSDAGASVSCGTGTNLQVSFRNFFIEHSPVTNAVNPYFSYSGNPFVSFE